VETRHVEGGIDVENHVCPVCLDIFLNPSSACLAGHSACRECHAKMVDPNKCFMCKTPVDSTKMMYMRYHADTIDTLPVCCDPYARDTNTRPGNKRSAVAMSGGSGAAVTRSGGSGAAAAMSGGKGASVTRSGGSGAAAAGSGGSGAAATRSGASGAAAVAAMERSGVSGAAAVASDPGARCIPPERNDAFFAMMVKKASDDVLAMERIVSAGLPAGEEMAGSGDNGEGMEEEMGGTVPVFGAVAAKGGSGFGRGSFRTGSVGREARIRPEAVFRGGGSSPRCSWKGPFGQIHEHWQKDCEYTFAQCQARGCREKVLLKDRDAHVELCKTTVIVCQGCNVQYQRHEFEDHEMRCQLVLLHCVNMPECKVQCIRGYMDHHLKNECHYAKIPCPFPGCRAKPIVRRDMPAHLKMCHTSGRKMHAAFMAFAEVVQELATAESEVRFATGISLEPSKADDPDIARIINLRISGWGCGFAESKPVDYGNRTVQARWVNSKAEARLGAGQELAVDQHGVFFGIRIFTEEDGPVQFTALLQLLDKYDGVAKLIRPGGPPTTPLSYDFNNSSDGLYFGDYFTVPALVAESCKREDGSFRVRAVVWIAPDAHPPKTGDGADAGSRSGAAGAGNGAGAAGAGNGAGAAGAGNGAGAMSQSSDDCVEVLP
jgi:hypothetical protein